MERIPVEILEKIFENILWENPVDLYQLRVVSKSWKNVIDKFIARLLQIWYKRTDNIPENYLNDIVKTKYSYAAYPWQNAYWRNSLLPHYSMNICKSGRRFSNFMPTKFPVIDIPSPSNPSQGRFSIRSIITNDDYIAVVAEVGFRGDKCQTRVYHVKNLSQHIREYSKPTQQIDFYLTERRKYILFLERQYKPPYGSPRIYLSEFLKNDQLLPTNLTISPMIYSIQYVITANECFTVKKLIVQHHALSGHNFEVGTTIEVPRFAQDGKIIAQVQIHKSNLYIIVLNRRIHSKVFIFKYDIVRDSDKQLSFPRNEICYYYKICFDIYESTHPIEKLKCLYIMEDSDVKLKIESFLVSIKNFQGVDHVTFRRNSKFQNWMLRVYGHYIRTMVVHGNYLIMGAERAKILVFRENLCDLIECADHDVNIGPQFTEITLPLPVEIIALFIVYIRTKPHILVQSTYHMYVINFTLYI